MSNVQCPKHSLKLKATNNNKDAVYDVIVIGSGIAGLNFALRAAERKLKILVITKSKIANTATSLAQGGIAAALSPSDNFKKHIKDTLVAGCYHNDKKAVSYMVKRGRLAIKRLIGLGVPLNRRLLAREGGHSERRIAFVSDYTGKAIENAFIKKVLKNPFISVSENTLAIKLLARNGVCAGAQILKNKKFKNIYSSIIALAAGGAGQLYSNTVTPEISTGDGIALAYRAGARLQDLEFIQFHPTALQQKSTRKFLISEAVRGEEAFLLNSKGERFMEKIHKLAELAPRDIVARAIFEEEKRGQVWLDLRHKNKKFLQTRFPQIYKTLKFLGIDMAKDLIPITPAAHYLCGGVKVNLDGASNIKNLYAFGETACTGVHGANRLASNSLLEAIVFSEKIPKKTVFKKNVSAPDFQIPSFRPSSKNEMLKIKKLKKELQKTMWRNVGIVRTKKSLEKALKTIKSINKKLSKMRGVNKKTIELENMILAAELIAGAALARKRSLGCHYLATD